MIQLERSVAHHHYIDDHPANVGHHHRGHHYVEASCYHLWVWVCLIPADIVAPVQLHHLADDGWKASPLGRGRCWSVPRALGMARLA